MKGQVRGGNVKNFNCEGEGGKGGPKGGGGKIE